MSNIAKPAAIVIAQGQAPSKRARKASRSGADAEAPGADRTGGGRGEAAAGLRATGAAAPKEPAWGLRPPERRTARDRMVGMAGQGTRWHLLGNAGPVADAVLLGPPRGSRRAARLWVRAGSILAMRRQFRSHRQRPAAAAPAASAIGMGPCGHVASPQLRLQAGRWFLGMNNNCSDRHHHQQQDRTDQQCRRPRPSPAAAALRCRCHATWPPAAGPIAGRQRGHQHRAHALLGSLGTCASRLLMPPGQRLLVVV